MRRPHAMGGIFHIVVRKFIGLVIISGLVIAVWLTYLNRESLAGLLPDAWTDSEPAQPTPTSSAEPTPATLDHAEPNDTTTTQDAGESDGSSPDHAGTDDGASSAPGQ